MFKKLPGKLSDLWTIPIALIIATFYNWISELLGLFSMTPEKIGKIVPATVIFLLVLGISRLFHTIQYPDTYSFGLMNNSTNHGQIYQIHKSSCSPGCNV
jgi:hypothetical protein